ncbi:MAG: serine/threonine-protein kinase, partial [Myxococcota bacterium]|nr:serine/threonine-protein kinase [Myxococcota bacterium]
MVSEADTLIGQVLDGKYRIDARLGRGGMGTVYRATQLVVDREVAVKVMRLPEELADEGRSHLVHRFHREAKATSQLKGPHTIRVFDFGETSDGLLFLVLEFLEGETLRHVIGRDAPMSPGRVAQIGQQLCRGLGEAHRRSIVHRDLKPDNVMLCTYGEFSDHVKILDFGIAYLLDPSSSKLTQEGMQ